MINLLLSNHSSKWILEMFNHHPKEGNAIFTTIYKFAHVYEFDQLVLFGQLLNINHDK